MCDLKAPPYHLFPCFLGDPGDEIPKKKMDFKKTFATLHLHGFLNETLMDSLVFRVWTQQHRRCWEGRKRRWVSTSYSYWNHHAGTWNKLNTTMKLKPNIEQQRYFWNIHFRLNKMHSIQILSSGSLSQDYISENKSVIGTSTNRIRLVESVLLISMENGLCLGHCQRTPFAPLCAD